MTTHRQPEHAEPTGSPAAGSPLRIVLVGRTGLDGSLRGEPGVELVRARTTLEAVGEVAAPPTSSHHAATVVVVGEGNEPASGYAGFLRALRLADPEAAVLTMNGEARAAGGEAFDGRISGRGGVAEIREALRDLARQVSERGRVGDAPSVRTAADRAGGSTAEPSRSPASGATPGRAGRGAEGFVDPKPTDAPVRTPRGGEAIGDAALLDAVSRGREAFIDAAMRLIHQRTGVENLTFVPEAVAEGALEGAVEVPGPDGPFGVLWRSGGEADAKAIAPHAAWLGGWLALQERQQALRRAAYTDPLTGAWNRRYFDAFLRASLDRAREARRTVTVLVFDIDSFKQYNDRFGHPAGDEILVETVRALKDSVRPSDRVCRIGGDEFAVVFDEPDGPRQQGSRPPESVYVLAKRVQRKIGEKQFPKLGADAPGELTISGGLAAFPWDGHDAETLLAKADELALRSKQQGKNAITLGPGAERVCRGEDDERR